MIIFKIITEKNYCLCNKFRNEILLSIESLSHVKIQPEMGFQNVVLPLTTLLKRARVTNLGSSRTIDKGSKRNRRTENNGNWQQNSFIF